MKLCATYSTMYDDGDDIVWVPDRYGEELQVGGETISRAKLGVAVIQLTRAAVSILEDELLFGVPFQTIADSIPLNTIQDRRQRQDPSYSFLQETPARTAQQSLVAQLLLQPRYLDHYAMNVDGLVSISAPRMRLYLRQAWKLQQIILTLLHLSSGQPARATELETMMLRNGPNSARSVFLLQDQIMTIIGYNKTTSLSRQEKYIARFLPKRASSILGVYLIVVRYFER